MLENVWIEILNMSLTASVVIVVICLIRLFLKRTPKIFSYVLWAVVLFRLLCPVSLESAVSFFNVMDSGVAAEQGRMEYISSAISYQEQLQVQLPAGTVSGSLSEGAKGDTVNEIVSDALPAANVGDSVNPMQIVIFVTAWVWLMGVAAMAVYQLVSLLRFRKCLQGAELQEDNIYCLKGGGTPFVYGVIRPRIYLPAGLSAGEKRYMLLHEQIHIRRGDQIFRFLGCVALCLHWFNPLVWLAFYLSGKDMELSCDEAVLKQLGNEVKKEYSGSLLSLAAGSGAGRMIRHIPIAFGEDNVKSRIQNVLRYRKTKPIVAVLAAVVCVAVAAALALNPSSEKAENESEIDQSAVEEDTASGSGNAEEEGTAVGAEDTYTVVMADESAAEEVPDVVLLAAQETVLNEMEIWRTSQEDAAFREMYGAYDYVDDRISSLELICTYENLDGKDYEVWLMNYEYLVDDPDAVVLAGAMEIDPEGWLTTHPDTCYLILEKVEDTLVFVTAAGLNDSSPVWNPNGFVDDMRTALANAAAR